MLKKFIFYQEMVDLAKKGLHEIGKYVLGRFMTSVKINSDDSFYEEIISWIVAAKSKTTFRNFKFITKRGSNNRDLEKQLDYGNYFIKLENNLIWVSVHSLDASPDQYTTKIKFRDEIKLTCLGSSDFLEKLLGKIKAEYEYKEARQIKIWMADGGSWSCAGYLQKEEDKSFLLESQALRDLDADVQDWRSSRSVYKAKGIPYRRGWLLYGPPGTGKTSIVKYLAKKYGMDLFVCNKESLSDKYALFRFRSQLVTNGILLFEDVDGLYSGRDRGDENTVNFSSFINILDGIPVLENVLIFMTSNLKEELDPALTRPGRIDRFVEIGYATWEQKQSMFQKFFPESSLLVPNTGELITNAEMQEIFLKSKTDLEALHMLGNFHRRG